jgi:hypothetical protein
MLRLPSSRTHLRRLFGLISTIVLLVPSMIIANATPPASFSFSTGTPDGRMGMASRVDSPGKIEIEAADDFVLSQPTTISSATFYGLLPTGAPLSSVTQVAVEIYRVFPQDSANPPSGMVPTRTNSPSDNAFDDRDTAAHNLTYTALVINPSFMVANSVLNGINKIPNQTTGGEGPVTGEEVLFTVNFANPFVLPADHYFFVPQVVLSGAGNFYWLSTTQPPLFTGDLQAWIRNANLDPDWLRVGTDIVGGATPPRFNGAFSLSSLPAAPLRPWTSAGSTSAVDEDSTNIFEFNNFVVGLRPMHTGAVTVRYNITATQGISAFCPATQSVVSVRFRNSDNSGTNARVAFTIHTSNITSGGNNTIFSFNSDGIGNGNAFVTASFMPSIDFDFTNKLYWIEATITRSDPAQFANLGSIQIWENAGTACP